MATIQIDQNEYDDFMDEEETSPYLALSAQLNSATSVAGAEFSAMGGALGYSTEAPKHWTDRLSDELDAVPVDEINTLYVQEEYR